MSQRRDEPPTWTGALGRAAFGAGIFLILLILIFKQPIGTAIGLSAAMFVIYIPMSMALDRFMYRRRVRSRMREREERKSGR